MTIPTLGVSTSLKPVGDSASVSNYMSSPNCLEVLIKTMLPKHPAMARPFLSDFEGIEDY